MRADNAIRTNVDEEDKLMHQISSSAQNLNMTIINNPNCTDKFSVANWDVQNVSSVGVVNK